MSATNAETTIDGHTWKKTAAPNTAGSLFFGICNTVLIPKEDKNQTEKATSHATGVSVALGLIAGIVIGSITGDVGLWLSLGIVFGAAFSLVKKKKLAPDGNSEHP